MTSDLMFRLLALLLMTIGLGISGYYRARADREGGKLPERPEGLPSNWIRAALGVAVWGMMILSIVAPERIRFSMVPLPDGVRWLGGVLGVFAVGLIRWTMPSIGTNVSQSISTRAHATLVTHGPYRWIRHPIYTSGLTLLLAAALMLQSLFLFALLIFFAGWLPDRVRDEERNLIGSYGDRYLEYMNRTGRFLPRLPGGSRWASSSS